MSKCYFLIEAGQTVDLSSNFYCVDVSSSKQGDRDFLFLIAHAACHNYYFELRSVESFAFISRLAQSLNVDFLPFRAVKARDLVRAIKKRVSLPFEPQSLNQMADFRRATCLSYRVSNALMHRK